MLVAAQRRPRLKPAVLQGARKQRMDEGGANQVRLVKTVGPVEGICLPVIDLRGVDDAAATVHGLVGSPNGILHRIVPRLMCVTRFPNERFEN